MGSQRKALKLATFSHIHEESALPNDLILTLLENHIEWRETHRLK
jgi:hypothetical protein